MFKVSASVAIHRPIGEVFAYVADPHNQHAWQLGLHEVTVDGNSQSEVRKIMGRRVEHKLEKVEHSENKKISHRGKGHGHESELSRTIGFADNGKSTTVTMDLEVDTKGMLKAGEPVMIRMLEREVRSDLEHLRDILEAHEDLETQMDSKFERHGTARV